jgi:cell division protein FtsB
MKGDSMATANQIKYRIGQAKKTIVKLNKEVTVTKAKIKKLESAFKVAKTVARAKPKKEGERTGGTGPRKR